VVIKRRRTYSSAGDCTSYENGSIGADCKVSNVESGHFLIAVVENGDVGLGSWVPKSLGISLVTSLSRLVLQSSVVSGLVRKHLKCVLRSDRNLLLPFSKRGCESSSCKA